MRWNELKRSSFQDQLKQQFKIELSVDISIAKQLPFPIAIISSCGYRFKSWRAQLWSLGVYCFISKIKVGSCSSPTVTVCNKRAVSWINRTNQSSFQTFDSISLYTNGKSNNQKKQTKKKDIIFFFKKNGSGRDKQKIHNFVEYGEP